MGDLTVRPSRELGNEENWLRCLKQLREQNATDKLLAKFSFEFGYHNQEATRTGRAIETAAERSGLELEWVN